MKKIIRVAGGVVLVAFLGRLGWAFWQVQKDMAINAAVSTSTSTPKSTQPDEISTVKGQQTPALTQEELKELESRGFSVVPVIINEKPILDGTYSPYFETPTDVLINYSVLLYADKKLSKELPGYSTYTLTVFSNDISQRGSLSLINVKCEIGLEIKMMLAGDICKKGASPASEFNLETRQGKTGASGELPMYIKGKGKVYMEFLVKHPNETTKKAQIIIHKGITFQVDESALNDITISTSTDADIEKVAIRLAVKIQRDSVQLAEAIKNGFFIEPADSPKFDICTTNSNVKNARKELFLVSSSFTCKSSPSSWAISVQLNGPSRYLCFDSIGTRVILQADVGLVGTTRSSDITTTNCR